MERKNQVFSIFQDFFSIPGKANTQFQIFSRILELYGYHGISHKGEIKSVC